ncbi:hypothetical protein V8E54_012201 [Elaphomyces granulatus]|jgi:hypothetical protein
MADSSNQNFSSGEENSRQPASTNYASLDGRQSGTIAAPGSQIAQAADLVSAEVSGQLSKEEADRLYEENIEEEYSKREGGA